MRPAVSKTAGELQRAITVAKSRAVGSGKPEAVLREAVQPILASALHHAGVRSRARDEMALAVPSIDLAGSLDAPLESRGRADAVYNRFVIEFEPPGSLRASKQHSATRHAVQQVQQYLRGLSHEYRIPMDRLAGCAFDGDWIVYVSGGRDRWSVHRPRRADPDALDALYKTLESMAVGRGLTAQNLSEDFGRDGNLAPAVTETLFAQFASSSATPRANELFRQWVIDLGNASGPFAPSDLRDWKQLCQDLGLPVDPSWARHVLFALQTYFALMAKLIGLIIVEGTYEVNLLDRMTGDPLEAFQALESGNLTSTLGTSRPGAVNLVEPGIFSWYAQDEYAGLSDVLGQLLEVAREYSTELGALEPPHARDLLKDLYQILLPSTIRHRLGEYYTPDWLAAHVIRRVVRRPLTPGTSVLDPACGSGTFLVTAAREMLARGVESSAEQLTQIRQGLIGFDLSPLAVQAAKVNYLLAMAPALRQTGESIFIPVYLADSVAPPRRGGLLDGDVYVLNSSVGEWRIPSYIVETPDLFPQLGELFAEALAQGLAGDEVVGSLDESHPGMPDSTRYGVEAIFDQLHDLHFHQRDGMWWNLITNAFAPNAYRDFDYIVGNPPWVSWETLPEAYRRENDSVWREYGLHPDAPPDRPQASRNVQLDLSMLFVARCVDRYLAEDGRLGFVITASVFQSELSGRGFRRRRLPGDRRYSFERVEDLTHLRVFEDASNQTAILIAAKEDQVDLPLLEATIWYPNGSAAIPTHASLEEVEERVRFEELHAEPVSPVDEASPLLMLPEEALRLSRPIRRRSPYLEDVREGINTRGANGIFFIEFLDEPHEGLVTVRNIPSLGRNEAVPQITSEIELGATRRLLRGVDVRRGEAEPKLGVLFFHDRRHTSRPIPDSAAREQFPRAYEFAMNFEEFLKSRRRFRNFDPRDEDWLGLYSVTDSAMAENKVAYREIANGTIAAPVLGADLVPDHKLYVIKCETAREADLLSSVINSDVVDYLVRAFSMSTSITGSLLRYIGIRRIPPDEEAEINEERMASLLGVESATYRRLIELAREGLPT